MIAHIAQEYNISRLTTQEGRNAYFGIGADGKMDLTKATGLTSAEVDAIRTLRGTWGESDRGPDGKPLPFGAAGKKKAPVPMFNELSPAPKTPKWVVFMKHMTSGFALLLEVGGLLCFIAYGMDSSSPDNLYLGIVLVSVVTLNGIFSYLQDQKSEAAMDSFKEATNSQCEVVRDGKIISQSVVSEGNFGSRELVMGDMVRMSDGNNTPADVYMLDGVVKVNNSNLTGEPDALERKAGVMGRENEVYPKGHELAGENKPDAECAKFDQSAGGPYEKCKNEPFEATNLCFFGTACEEGKGTGIVVRMSDETALGQISNDFKELTMDQIHLSETIRCSVSRAWSVLYAAITAAVSDDSASDKAVDFAAVLTMGALLPAPVSMLREHVRSVTDRYRADNVRQKTIEAQLKREELLLQRCP